MSALSPLQAQPQFPPAPVGCALCLFWGAGLYLLPSRGMSTIQNLRKSLVRNWEPVCSLVGVPFLGLSLPLSHPRCLLSPAGDGPVHRRLALLWNCSVPLFCKRPAVCLGRLIFSLSLLLSPSLSCYLR